MTANNDFINRFATKLRDVEPEKRRRLPVSRAMQLLKAMREVYNEFEENGRLAEKDILNRRDIGEALKNLRSVHTRQSNQIEKRKALKE